MRLFKIIQQLLQPSVMIFIVLAVSGIMAIMSRCRKAMLILLLTGSLFYYLLSISVVADVISAPLINQYQSVISPAPVAAWPLVILTGSILDRASEALRLYTQMPSTEPAIKIIISGTSAMNPADYNQAVKTKQFLIERGIPEANIIMEIKARNTFESAQNIKNLLGAAPFYLITSATHMPRAMFIFTAKGGNPVPAPAPIVQKNQYGIFDFFPNPENMKKIDSAMHEYLGLLYYRLRLRVP